MKEQLPKQGNNKQPTEIPGKLIFDKDGKCIGISAGSGTLDYVSPKDKKSIVIVIKPPKKGK